MRDLITTICTLGVLSGLTLLWMNSKMYREMFHVEREKPSDSMFTDFYL